MEHDPKVIRKPTQIPPCSATTHRRRRSCRAPMYLTGTLQMAPAPEPLSNSLGDQIVALTLMSVLRQRDCRRLTDIATVATPVLPEA